MPNTSDTTTKIQKISEDRRMLLEKYLREKRPLPRITGASTITRRPMESIAPLSFGQQQMWLISQLVSDSAAYNEGAILHMPGSLNVAILEQSLNEIIQRHEAWRTSFPIENGQPFQKMHPSLTFTLPVVDLRHLPEDERKPVALQLAEEDAQLPFDLANIPLVRVTLLRLHNQEHWLCITMHHIICDGITIYEVFLPELWSIYEAFCAGRPSPLPPLPIQYADFAVWQRERLSGDALTEQMAYWKQQLQGAPPLLELPCDHPRPPVQTYRGSRHTFALTKELTKALKALSGRENVTLYVTLVAAFQTLLHRYTGQTDLLIGTVTGERKYLEIQKLMGYFLNTLVLRTRLTDNPSFRELLIRTREVTLEARSHQDVPFEFLVKELQPERNLAQNPLVQVLFSFEPQQPPIDSPWSPVWWESKTHTAKFDLSLELDDQPQGLVGWFEYRTDLFEEATIARMAGHWQVLLESIVADPEQRLSDLSLLTEKEHHQLLVEWNATESEYPKDRGIHQLFEEQVERTPEAVAVVFEDKQLTYRELNMRANQLAHYLQTLDVGPEALVGVYMQRSIELVVALMGILKAGGAYVPLDPTYPPMRLEYMMQDAQLSVLITQSKLVEALSVREGAAVVIVLDSDRMGLDTCEKWNCNPESLVGPENVAYMIYTSGSTGKPKGVVNIQRSLVNRIWWMQQAYHLTSEDAVMQKTPFSFDVSVWEFFWPLMSGARLIVARPDGHRDPAYLVELIKEQQITTIHFVPSMLQAFLTEPSLQQSMSLKRVICSGEALSVELKERFFVCFSHIELHNLYGPTEAAIDVTSWQCMPNRLDRTVPIGRPIANTQLYILDRARQPVPIGVAGELYIGGDNVAHGYYRRPELTAEKFLPDPFHPETSMHLFKTGDMARYQENGAIEFLGRIDYQVKIRGFRIELGEIEVALSQHPAVKEAVVVAHEDNPGDKQLVAYVVLYKDQTVVVDNLKSHIAKQLPGYMVPSFFVLLEVMPLTPNGKIDIHALPAPDASRDTVEETYVVPTQMIHYQLIAIWEELLSARPIGIRDNFFYLGGHSLLAVRMLERIKQVFEQKLQLATFFAGPTIEQLALVLQGQVESGPQPPVKAIQIQAGEGAKRPFFFLHGNWRGDGFYCYPLARALGEEQPFYALPPYSLDGLQHPPTLQEMAAAYIETLRMKQPEGPYMLGGWCNGALVAFEIARQLHMQGQEVNLLALVHPSNLVLPVHIRWARSIINRLGCLLPLPPEKQLDWFLRLCHMSNYLRHPDYQQTTEFKQLQVASQIKLAGRGKRNSWLFSHLRILVPAVELLHTYEPIFTWIAAGYAPSNSYPGKTIFLWHRDEDYDQTSWRQVIASTQSEEYTLPGNHDTLLTKYLSELAEQLRLCIENV